jgi:hypothetical protein
MWSQLFCSEVIWDACRTATAFDPESADEMVEPFSSPGLFARARKLRSAD